MDIEIDDDLYQELALYAESTGRSVEELVEDELWRFLDAAEADVRRYVKE